MHAPLPIRGGPKGVPQARIDPALQQSFPSSQLLQPAVNFEGVNNGDGVLPPDVNGDVGPSHYVQWVNLSFAIYQKDGTRLYGPARGSTLFSGFGGPCETSNDGDPIVLYDELAGRWLMSQFALPNYPNGPFYQCIAISTTGNPAGSYYRYAFKVSDTKLNDYPKFGVWPDGYYMAINQFAGSNWGGQGVVVFERNKMLVGQQAQMVYFDLYGVDQNLGGMLPSDLDGTAPAAGTPNYFMEIDDDAWGYSPDQIQVWAFRTNWTTPSASRFDWVTSLPVAAFDANLCGYSRNCVPQPGTTRKLDAISDRLMYRLQYRNLGTTTPDERWVVNHTVDVDGSDRAGVRWYELHRPGGTFAVRQHGTFSPDAQNRWMASAAMDKSGNIAVGYNVSSGSVYPSIRYTGRQAGDSLGQLTLGEADMMVGTGSQTYSNPLSPGGRWGDYSMLAVDPVDGCTFWATLEYYATTSTAGWQTRIAAFTLPGCGTTSTPLAAPSGLTANAASSTSVDLAWTDNSGSNEDGFAIERCSGAGCSTFAQIATTTQNAVSYPDTTVAASTAYTYRVRAFSGTTYSTYSNLASATTAGGGGGQTSPIAPTDLTATPTKNSIRLAWTDKSTNEDRFEIERSTSGGTFAALATVGANTTSYNDTSAAKRKSYQYRVRACNSSGCSGFAVSGTVSR